MTAEYRERRHRYVMEGKGREALNLTEVMARDTEAGGAIFVLGKLIEEVRERLTEEHERYAYAAGDAYLIALSAHAIKRGAVVLRRLGELHAQLQSFEEKSEKWNPVYVDEQHYPTNLEPYE